MAHFSMPSSSSSGTVDDLDSLMPAAAAAAADAAPAPGDVCVSAKCFERIARGVEWKDGKERPADEKLLLEELETDICDDGGIVFEAAVAAAAGWAVDATAGRCEEEEEEAAAAAGVPDQAAAAVADAVEWVAFVGFARLIAVERSRS